MRIRSEWPLPAAVAAAFTVSWLAMLAHNLYELPITPIDPDNTGPLLVDVALLAACVVRPNSTAVWSAVLGWALLNLVVGGVITVLPLPILPFVPEQSLGHYLAHVVYGVGQVPLTVLAWTALRRVAARRPA